MEICPSWFRGNLPSLVLTVMWSSAPEHTNTAVHQYNINVCVRVRNVANKLIDVYSLRFNTVATRHDAETRICSV